MLKLYSKRYLPGTQPLGVNLMRKKMHREALGLLGRGGVLDQIETADKHSKSTALNTYFAMDYQAVAIASNTC